DNLRRLGNAEARKIQPNPRLRQPDWSADSGLHWRQDQKIVAFLVTAILDCGLLDPSPALLPPICSIEYDDDPRLLLENVRKNLVSVLAYQLFLVIEVDKRPQPALKRPRDLTRDSFILLEE